MKNIQIKSTLLVVIIAVIIQPIVAQDIVEKAKLTYVKTLTIIKPGSTTNEEKIKRTTFAYNKNNLKLENSFIANLQMVSIEKANTNSSIFYLDNGTKKVQFADVKNAIFNIGVFDSNTGITYTYKKDTSTIGEIPCKKAIAKYYADGEEKNMEIWYDETRKLQLPQFNYLFHKLNGMVVQCSYEEKSKIMFPGMENVVMKVVINLEMFDDTIEEDVVQMNDEKLYELVDKNDIMKYVSFGTKAKTNQPKGEAITETIKSKDGLEMKVTKYNPFTLNQPLQPFTGNTLQGKEVNATTLNNKIVVLNFWFTQCKPCIKEMPILNEVKNKYLTNNNIDFYSITYNTKQEVEKLFETIQYNFTPIVNAQHIIDQYNVFTYPATIILDKTGIVKFIKIGEFTNAIELTTEIEKVVSG